jgi:glucose/arabinose dehydrogenase
LNVIALAGEAASPHFRVMKTPTQVGLLSLVLVGGGAVGCDDGDPAVVDASRGGGAVADAAVPPPPSPDARPDAPVTADAGMIAVNRPERRDFVPMMLQELKVPAGFRVQAFASDLTDARMIATTPEGDVFVTLRMAGEVVRLRDLNNDGDASDEGERVTAASAMETPALEGVHGITYHMGRVYLATVKSVLAATPMGGRLGAIQTLVMDLPDGGQHPNRTLAVGPDGKLYVSVGSSCNACGETNPEHATMLRLELTGMASANPANTAHPMLARNPMARISPRVFASGLRNTIGFDWHPQTMELWGSDHGSDGLGDDVPPDEIVLLTGGKSYGWPYCWGRKNVDPVIEDPRQDLPKASYCPGTEGSAAEYPAHSAPIAFLFYRGGQFPAEYQGDAFVAFHGSWNRSLPTGYKVVRVRFTNGVPGPLPGGGPAQEDFLSGFLMDSGRAYFGRPAGLAVDATGALLVGDDSNGVIYRVSYSASGTPDGGAAGN